MKLEFLVKEAIPSDGYSGGYIYKKEFRSLSGFYEWQLNLAKDSRPNYNRCTGIISLCVQRKSFGRSKYIYAVDCDSESDRNSALQYARDSLRVEATYVESSPGHFWVIFDQILSFKELVHRADATPGCDHKWVSHCKEIEEMGFRAYPRNTEFPKFSGCTLTNPLAIEWYTEFVNYFKSPYYASLKRTLIKNKVIEDSVPVNYCSSCGDKYANPEVTWETLKV
jgi:hypothetical protein